MPKKAYLSQIGFSIKYLSFKIQRFSEDIHIIITIKLIKPHSTI